MTQVFLFFFFPPQARNHARHSRKAASQIACAPLSSAARGACGPDLINAENKVTDQPVRRVPWERQVLPLMWSESGEKFSKEASRGFNTTSLRPPLHPGCRLKPIPPPPQHESAVRHETLRNPICPP